MIDIHSHILPNIDDGSKSEYETPMLLTKAVEEKITDIVATPHYDNNYKPLKEIILSKVDFANQIAQKNDLAIKVHCGQEVRIYDDLISNLDKHLTIDNKGKSMLIEFPEDHVPLYAEKIFYDLQLKGIQPILVHPERNTAIMNKPNLLYNFVNRGVLTQITAGSIVGKFGKNAKKTAFKIIEHELVHLIASDVHHLKTRDFHMQKATKILKRKYGNSYSDYLLDNAEHLINNAPIYSGYPSSFN